MCAWIKRLATPVAALFLLGLMPMAASASTITFTTTGKFTNAGTGATLVGNNLLVNGATISFSGITKTEVVTDDGDPKSTIFGSFSSSIPLGNASFSGAEFQLSIDQTFPSSPGNPDGGFHSVQTGVGKVFLDGSGSLHLLFQDPLFFTTNSVPPTIYVVNQDQNLGMGVQVQGTVGVLPLPGVAVGGLWLLGGIGSVGGLNALRRRFGFTAAA